MPATLTRTDETLELDLSTGTRYEFNDALIKVRSMKERGGLRFDFDRKLWIFEATPAKAEEVISMIQPLNYDEEIRDWIIESKKKAEDELTTALPSDAGVQVPWGHQRAAWQPESVNDEPFNGLLDYQRSAVDHLARVKRAILADDMGLGKTLEGISTVEEYILRNPNTDGTSPVGPRLVICPASVMGSWNREFGRWLEPHTYGVQLVDHRTPQGRHKQLIRGIVDNMWVVVNWEQLRVERQIIKVNHRSGATGQRAEWHMKEPLFEIPHIAWMEPSLDDLDHRLIGKAKKMPEATGWLAVLADEAHRAKNRHAKQSRGLLKVYGQLMLALTGTPIMNSPDEIWMLLRWLWPHQYDNFERFFNEYVDWYENPNITGGKPIITGVKNPDQLRFELKGRLVRRTTGQVWKSLPGRRRIYFSVPLLPKQQALYDTAEKDFWLNVEQDAKRADKEGENARAFLEAVEKGATVNQLYALPNGAARLVRLRQVIETPATLGGDPDSALIRDFIDKYEDSRPEPWLVFCEFKETTAVVAELLKEKGAKVAVYTGETPKHERTKLEDRFQRGDIDVLVGTIGAMKEGITLTYGHLQYWMSRDYVPANNEQGERRQADRLGQQQRTMIYIPQAADTVAETKVPGILKRKEGIVRTVVAQDAIEEVNS